MANVIHADFGHASHGIFGRLSAVVADYRLYRRTLAELEALSDRELQDLGMSRLCIRDVAREAVYGA